VLPSSLDIFTRAVDVIVASRAVRNRANQSLFNQSSISMICIREKKDENYPTNRSLFDFEFSGFSRTEEVFDSGATFASGVVCMALFLLLFWSKLLNSMI
jgi:hypothetical protein